MPAERLLVVRPTGGLCNRLRALCSFMVVAEHTGRVLRVHWGPGSGWSTEDLADLFDISVDRIGEDEYEELRERSLRLDEVVVIEGVMGGRSTWRWAPGRSLEQVFDAPAVPVVSYAGYRRADVALGPPAVAQRIPGFADGYATAVRALTPVAAIRQDLDRVSAPFTSSTIGVHIRRGDRLALKATALETLRSSERAFVRAMDSAVAANPEATFFLATDTRDVEDRFKARYGPKLHTNSSKRFVPSVLGQPKDNQRDAVIDLFALARTSRILGSHNTSFTDMAATLGGVPTEHVRDSYVGTAVRHPVHAWNQRHRVLPLVLARLRPDAL